MGVGVCGGWRGARARSVDIVGVSVRVCERVRGCRCMQCVCVSE